MSTLFFTKLFERMLYKVVAKSEDKGYNSVKQIFMANLSWIEFKVEPRKH